MVPTIAKSADKQAKAGPAAPAGREWGGATARAPTPPPRRPPAAKTVGWGSAWGAAAPRVPKQGAESEETRRKGFLICAPGRERGALQPDLAKQFCERYAVKGESCDDQHCRKKHVPFYKWTRDKREKQIAYAKNHRNYVLFNGSSIRPSNLPTNKAHLIKNGEQ